MDEKQLIILSAIGSIITLFAIYIFVSFFAFNNVKINDISRELVGRTVNVSGTIEEVNNVNGNSFIYVSDETGRIKIVIWKDSVEALAEKNILIDETIENRKVTLLGDVTIYNGILELILKNEQIMIF